MLSFDSPHDSEEDEVPEMRKKPNDPVDGLISTLRVSKNINKPASGKDVPIAKQQSAGTRIYIKKNLYQPTDCPLTYHKQYWEPSAYSPNNICQ